jgi:hypothetical protein
MIWNAKYIQKLNKSQKVAKEWSAKMIAQFPIAMVLYFGSETYFFKKMQFIKKNHNKVKGTIEKLFYIMYNSLIFHVDETLIFEKY